MPLDPTTQPPATQASLVWEDFRKFESFDNAGFPFTVCAVPCLLLRKG